LNCQSERDIAPELLQTTRNFEFRDLWDGEWETVLFVEVLERYNLSLYVGKPDAKASTLNVNLAIGEANFGGYDYSYYVNHGGNIHHFLDF